MRTELVQITPKTIPGMRPGYVVQSIEAEYDVWFVVFPSPIAAKLAIEEHNARADIETHYDLLPYVPSQRPMHEIRGHH